MTARAMAATLDTPEATRPPTPMPDDSRTRPAEDARAPSRGLKWPGLTTAQSLAVASQFGVSLAIGVGLGLVAGQWLDGQVHTGILFTLIGVFTGLVAGITSIVALYRATLRSSELEWRGESAPKGKTTPH
jgi:F0F1-type ATP synthase assembly protein I